MKNLIKGLIDKAHIEMLKQRLKEGEMIEIVSPSPVFTRELKLAIPTQFHNNMRFTTNNGVYIPEEEQC